MAELLTRVDPVQYKKHVVMKKGKKVLYVHLNKSLYGTLNAELLFWENISRNLMNKWGFKLNPYDKFVANKTIDER